MSGTDPGSEVVTDPAHGVDALEDAIRSIGGHARASNLARAHSLAAALAGPAVGVAAEDGRRHAADLAHQIAGSAGTFGFPQASALAAELERSFLSGRLDAERLGAARRQVEALLADLSGEPNYS